MRFYFFLLLSFVLFESCDTEDARTPLGITISAPDVELSIPENPSEGLLLTTLSAVASDGSVITYTIDSETPEGAVILDPTTGEISVGDASLFSFEQNTEINLAVNAVARSLTEEILVTIFIEEFLDATTDRETLETLYLSNFETTDEEGMTTIAENSLNWDLESEDIGSWTGVVLNSDSRVTALDLSSSELINLPTSINRLSELTSLNLSNNQLNFFPDSLSDLENLSLLNISLNTFIGQLSEVLCERFEDNENIEFIKDEEATCGDIEESETSNG